VHFVISLLTIVCGRPCSAPTSLSFRDGILTYTTYTQTKSNIKTEKWKYPKNTLKSFFIIRH